MSTQLTVNELFHRAVAEVGDVEATHICGHIFHADTLSLLWQDSRVASNQERRMLQQCIKRRQTGEPIAYILGKRSFFGLEFIVDCNTLIPRPDTESLVEKVLPYLDAESSVLDLGTGSGAIGISLAVHSGCAITLTDISKPALQIAQRNAEKLNINAKYIHSDWYGRIPKGETYDLITSNPPYVSEGDPHLQQGDLPFEPDLALVGGSNGLEHISQVVRGAPLRLKKAGSLAVEHGFDQADEVRRLFLESGFSDVQLVQDINSQPRVTLGQSNG